MEIKNRRNFLKKGLLGVAGTSLFTGTSAKKLLEINTSVKNPFVYRTLGKTEIKLPIVSMGTGDTNNPKLVQAALEEGIKLLATSRYYGEGNNERMVGKVVKGRPRDSYLLMTSVAPNAIDHQAGIFKQETDVNLFIEDVEKSLKALDVNEIDILLLPFSAKRESVFFEPLLRAMENFKKQGLARYIGIATHSWEHEAIRAATDTKIYDVVLTAYNFRKNNLEKMHEAIDYAADQGLGIIAMKTMAGSYWDKDKQEAINGPAALKWVLQNNNIHTCVPGITTFDQLQLDVGIMGDLSLTEQERADLRLGYRHIPSGLYCQQCGQCIDQCPHRIDIPTYMRSYMYAYGYGNMANAKKALEVAHLKDISCSDCGDCPVRCVMNFKVRDKILDISRLASVPDEFLLS
jgi:predicted aldo/keto reductase-like oxidoreductase